MSEQAKREQTAMELNDDLPEQVSDGVEIGAVVNIRSSKIDYCAGCGKKTSVSGVCIAEVYQA